MELEIMGKAIIGVFYGCIAIPILMLCWHYSVVPIFGFSPLSVVEAICLFVACRILLASTLLPF